MNRQSRHESVRREVMEHPVVTEAIRILGGEIIEIKELS